MTGSEATRRALKAGATPAQIDHYTAQFAKSKRTVPVRNMIKALQLHPWLNTADDWARLAGALSA